MNTVLEIRDLHKSYYQGKKEIKVLKGINCAIEAGTINSILGTSGTGKSTLLHIMGSIEKATAGEIFFNGSSIGNMVEEELAVWRNEKIGFVFQFYNLLPEFSALENVIMPGMMNDSWKKKEERNGIFERARMLLKEVGLESRINHKPSDLSGGEQQRVAIARALINNPVMLLADEPTGNLDRNTGENVYELLINMSRLKNKAVVIATHDEALASKTDKLFHLKDGILI